MGGVNPGTACVVRPVPGDGDTAIIPTGDVGGGRLRRACGGSNGVDDDRAAVAELGDAAGEAAHIHGRVAVPKGAVTQFAFVALAPALDTAARRHRTRSGVPGADLGDTARESAHIYGRGAAVGIRCVEGAIPE